MRQTPAPSSPPHLLYLLHRHGLPPALLGSLAAVAMLTWRIDWSRHSAYAWLPWNLFLAWAPYVLALVARLLMERGIGGWGLLPLAAAWLVALPNAPYLLTDLIHLRARQGIPLWFDAALLALFAATGWLLGLLSLEVWKRWLEERLGRVGAWAGVAVASVLCGYGIYLGRVERWNSWHVLTAPGSLLSAVLAHLRAPDTYPHLRGLTLLFAVLVLGSYIAFESLPPLERPAAPRAPSR